jgi:hypothetical protein
MYSYASLTFRAGEVFPFRTRNSGGTPLTDEEDRHRGRLNVYPATTTEADLLKAHRSRFARLHEHRASR